MEPKPDTLYAYCTLDRVDHVDTHLLVTDQPFAKTPEQWAREIMEGPSVAMRARLTTGWTMLGLRVHHRGRDAIAGWPIAHRDTDYVRLQADSLLGLTGQLVTRVTEGGIEFTTFAQLDNAWARAMWARVLPTHLEIVERLLREAAERTH